MNRRNFLKLLTYGLLGQYIPNFVHVPQQSPQSRSIPNILVLVFDAWSAKNMSLFGYSRKTTPNIDQLANKAVVFHNHYAAGPFTAPGTASMLTGLYPWKHRVLKCGNSLPPEISLRNIFSLLDDKYFKIAYTHNSCADYLLSQQKGNISKYIPRSEFFFDKDIIFDDLLSNDFEVSNLVRQLSMFRHKQILQSSIFLQWIYSTLKERDIENYLNLYPRGIPQMGDSAQRFIPETAVDWLLENISDWPNPFFGYLHFLPPHAPYRTRSEFIDVFKDDGFKPTEKPLHPLSPGISKEQSIRERQDYDEFILLIDSEFSRIYDALNRSGALENTWIFLTSDHGESFERGEYHHTTKLLFDPVIRVPLLIFPPKQNYRIDIHQPTSAIDLVPTILNLANISSPDWLEGVFLPLKNEEGSGDRKIYSMNAEFNKQYAPFTTGTVAMIYEGYKIMKLFGYPELNQGKPRIEIYNLYDDTEELDNLVHYGGPIINELVELLETKIDFENQPYL